MAQRMKEPSITDPPLLLDQFVMHDGDVGCCTAEADPPQLKPKPQRFPERGRCTAATGLSCGIPGSESRIVPSTQRPVISCKHYNIIVSSWKPSDCELHAF
jgi:hypothetical protein